MSWLIYGIDRKRQWSWMEARPSIRVMVYIYIYIYIEDAHAFCIEPLRCSAVAGDLLKKLRHAYQALLDNVFQDCDEPDFGISEFERALRRRRLRARLWRGSGRYRRGKVPLLQ